MIHLVRHMYVLYLPFFLVMVFHSSSGAFSAAGDTITAALGLPALPPFCQAVQCSKMRLGEGSVQCNVSSRDGNRRDKKGEDREGAYGE
jgi:hypothetical protein